MKISAITLTNWRNHLQTKIVDLGAINYFVGANGAGKSSILDAIAFAMTGVCRGVDEGGRGADALKTQITGGPKASTAVTLKTSAGEIVRGVGQGPRSQAHMAIRQQLGLDDRFLRVVSAPTNLLRLDRKKQEEVFFALAGGAVDRAAVEKVLADCGIKNDLAEIAERILTPAGRESYLSYLKERRPAIKREIAELVYAPVEGLPKANPTVRQTLEKTAASLNSDINRIRAEVQAAESSRRHLEDLRRQQQSRLDAVGAIDKAGIMSAEQVESARASLARSAELRGQREKLDADIAKLAMEAGNIKREAERIKAIGGTCSKCLQAIAADHSEKVLAEMWEKYKTSKTDWDLAKVTQNALLLETDDRAILEKLSRHERAVQQNAVISSAAAGVQQSLADIDAKLADLPLEYEDWRPLDQNLLAIVDQIKELTRAEAEEQRANRVNMTRTGFEDDLAEFELLIKTVGPGGPIQQMMAADGVAEFVGMVQKNGERLGVGQIDIAFGPWQIMLNGRPIELASASEEWRVAAAFGIAFAVKAKASFVCLDGAEIIRGDNRDLLQALVLDSGLEQIFVAAAIDEAPEDVQSSGVGIYVVEADARGAAQVRALPVLEKGEIAA